MLRNLFRVGLFVLFVTGCSQFQRPSSPRAQYPRSSQPQTSKSDQTFDGETKSSTTDSDFQEGPVSVSQPQIPKVGLILGPGMAKSMAHAGVLSELVKAKIPIDAIVGLGWGSVPGALYAKEGKVHEVAWRLYKLKKEDLPKPSMFSSQMKPVSVDSMSRFLSDGLKGQSFQSLAIPFFCAHRLLEREKVVIAQRGSGVEGLKRCMAFPPFFGPVATTAVGAVSDASSAARFLRQRGMNVVVLVDVLSTGSLVEGNGDKYRDQLLWDLVRQSLRESRQQMDELIKVNTRGIKITDFSDRRVLVKRGEEAGRSAARALATKYGF